MNARFLSLCMLLMLAVSGYGADEPLSFEDGAKQERYQNLLEELRCLVCQNQSLADSNADLAQDLRAQVFDMVGNEMPDREITDYLVERYGEFVLYRPRLSTGTIMLWFGPFILLLFALYVVFRMARQSRAVDVELSEKEKARVSELLNPDQRENRN